MNKGCHYCKRGVLVFKVEDLLNPYKQCSNCGATVTLPVQRYFIQWSATPADSKMSGDTSDNRNRAMVIAMRGMHGESDVATISDRWDIDKDVIIRAKDVTTSVSPHG